VQKACSDSWDEVVKVKEEERAARTVFNAKRHEISTVQSVINKLNKANSIDDMDDLVRNAHAYDSLNCQKDLETCGINKHVYY
jgi:hypothetical protein